MPVNNDVVFINWNKATLKSINKQIELAKNNSEMVLYKNRLLAFKALISIDDSEKVNANSIRYKFINEIMKNGTNRKEFYIIEANHSGEQVELRNYVVYPIAGDIVDTYNLIGNRWVKGVSSKKLNLNLNVKLKKNRTQFGLGINQDDIIITQFIDNTVNESEYYLFTTLSNVSGIKKLLILR
ncbi:hypothetical protein [Mucilaginibacter flavidus]|uniref:hypothetical protein n=1 Tax=Mucilaginibacter flavidus TaxID=2949309 RepID=UPI0020932FD2|nr:hypothetical protein [Mucilaginibacter flavidus]MCO5949818.1 hypothetical protein [Mucilaginibacter flavidus]